MNSPSNKQHPSIALGISGSIAAYKSLYLARLLVEDGYRVHALLTRSARQFVTPLSLSVLTGHRAITNLWTASEAGADVSHVELAHAIDLLIIAPATADLLTRLAQGEASDPVSSVALSTQAIKLLAPAMEPAMWSADTTRASIEALQTKGWQIIAPTEGFLASGRSGVGRMSEPSDLFDAVKRALTPQDLAGIDLIVTAGPTREHIDPARYISNPSSGKMGLALAQRAAARGAKVTLIHGPVSSPIPRGLYKTVAIKSTHDLLTACETALKAGTDGFVMAAAPADFRPAVTSTQKTKKSDGDKSTLALESNPDILKTLLPLRRGVLTVGFAAESQDLERYATQKLQNKALDLIVGNYVGSSPQTGFASDTNEVWIYSRGSEALHIPLAPKAEVADQILNCLAEQLRRD